MEAEGLVTRRRDSTNRRIQLVELTKEGEALFNRLRSAAVVFDKRLRAGLTDDDVDTLERLLGRLRDNLAGDGMIAPRPNYD
jgi:MarR family transcriptional regulator, transcriptional regulator for hemolysin